MIKFNSLTNVRPTKDLGCKIVASPTEGQFKITPEASKVLDVSTGDYLQLVEAGGNFYAVKGSKELGGGKIGAANKTGAGVLNFSGAKAWDDMGGDSNFNTMFDLDAENAVEQEGRVYYPLNASGKEEKQARKSSNKEENSNTEVGSATMPETPSASDVDTDFDDI